MRLAKVLISIVLFFCALFFSYLYWFDKPLPISGTVLKPMRVTTAPAKPQLFTPNIEAVGTAKAFESVVISSNVTEYLRKIYFKDGQSVKKGEVLVSLETAEEKAQLASLKAKYRETKLRFERSQKLHKQRYVASSEYDTNQAQMEFAKAQIQTIEAKINDRIIKAPFDGVLGIKQVSEGALLEAGDPIVTLDMLDPIKVDMRLPARFLSQIKIGQTIKVKTAAYPKRWFTGKINVISSRFDEQTRTIKVIAIISNKQTELHPGMLFTICIPTKPKKVFLIPEQALLAQGTERYIYVIEDNKAKKVIVKLIARHNAYVEIEANLEPQQAVVVEGGFKLKPNQAVDVKHVAI